MNDAARAIPAPALGRTPLVLAIRQILGLAALASIAAAGPVAAQGKLEARYTATLAGIPIGEGSWRIEIGRAHV